MKTEKLFNVLVIGGNLLVGMAVVAEEAWPAFCSSTNSETCELNENGESVPRQGVECCWGTSCGNE